MSKTVCFYEVLPEIKSEDGDAKLVASFTPNNGIRVGIVNEEIDDGYWREFDFTPDQAETIGQALVRWAQRNRAKTELNRCHYPTSSHTD